MIIFVESALLPLNYIVWITLVVWSLVTGPGLKQKKMSQKVLLLLSPPQSSNRIERALEVDPVA